MCTDRNHNSSEIAGEYDLLTRLRALEKRVHELENKVPSVRDSLLHRGFRVVAENSTERVLLPSDPDQIPPYLRLLKRYSSRLLLRDVISNKRSFELGDLLHYCSLPKAQTYIRALERMGLVERLDPRHWRLTSGNGVRSFGETLEWFVAQILRREFHIQASWSVSILQLQHGGDFDVLAAADGRLLYVETKSSPPRNLHMEVVSGFALRVKELRPDIAIFLVDTHLRMQDKVNKMLRAAFFGERADPQSTVQLARGVFRIATGLYVTNSKPEIRKNLAVCLRDAFAGPVFPL